MIDQLRLAGDQFRAAWDNYLQVCSNINDYITQDQLPQTPGFFQELTRELNRQLDLIYSYEPKIQEIIIAFSHARNHIRHAYDIPEMVSNQHDVIAAFLSHGPNIQEIRDINSHAPSYSPGTALINTLPPEILIRIFHLVLASPCNLHRISSGTSPHYPRYPDYLAQVCSLWREATISNCSLWCHMDLSLEETCYQRLTTRAERHLARAGTLPIELHITASKNFDLSSTPCDFSDLYELVSRISGRVETLEFASKYFQDFQHELFVRILLGQQSQSIFKRLVARSGTNDSHFPITPSSSEPGDLDQEFRPFMLNLTEGQIENSFAPLTMLHLHGIFPIWSSKAYHGLVDLRLLPTNARISLKEAQFRTILEASPGLRILHFGLFIRDSSPDTEKITRVHLQDLRVVKVFPDYPLAGENLCPSKVLRLLAPGTKPLSLSFEDYYIPSNTLLLEMERFFAISRVTRFYTRVVFPPMSLLLRHTSNLQLVVIDHFESFSEDEVFFTEPQVDESASLPHLRSLHIARSILSEGDLHMLFECCPDGIVLYSCDFISTRRKLFDTERLSHDFPTVRVTDHNLYAWEAPTSDWDLIG
ncbi:hypothetical protein OPQ81_005107 [Rhizoctonia solani]|nr:hypothetical protein OPQ81_005107 [Rhizoctonia solani]